MWYFQNHSFTYVLLLICTTATYSTEIPEQIPCPVLRLCSSVEDVVWATDELKCFVFRNNCYLDNENCSRQNNYIEELKLVPKEQCQKLCPAFCTRELAPICAQYNGDKKTFSNKCILDVSNCNTGMIYELPVPGEC